MKLSFKRGPKATGIEKVANPYPFVYIKGDKKQVGWISPPTTRGPLLWRIHLHVKRDQGFENVTLRYKATSEEDARRFVTYYWDALQKHKLHQLGDN